MPDKSPFLTVALEAAKAAEEVITNYYAGDITVSLKEDQSPVTAADKEAEKVIIETIRAAFPDHGFLGEESGSSAAASEYTWIIDPIDGTKNFIRHIPLFSTLIALRKNDELLVGVSNMPAQRELLYAEKGKGAYQDDTRLSVSSVSTLQESLLSQGGIAHFKKSNTFSNVLALIDAVGRNRGFGDTWQYHLLAQGKLEVVLDPKVRVWDVAAIKVIVEEAGGRCTDKDGNEMGEGAFVSVATNGILHDEVLTYFAAEQ